MAKRSKKTFDIHHPDMVKMIFILTSIAILAFLVLVVKYTSFKSEPKAVERQSQNKIFIKSNGVSCKKEYPEKVYAACEVSCGWYKLTWNLKWVQSEPTSTACGTYTTKPPIYPNYSPWDIRGILNRPTTTQTAYCCVSK